MDNFNKKILSLLFVITSLFSIWQLNENSKLKKTFGESNRVLVDSLNKKISNLEQDLFVEYTTISRYEIALDMLLERDSVCGKKFQDILYKETE